MRYWLYAAYKHDVTLGTYIAYTKCHLLLNTHVLMIYWCSGWSPIDDTKYIFAAAVLAAAFAVAATFATAFATTIVFAA